MKVSTYSAGAGFYIIIPLVLHSSVYENLLESSREVYLEEYLQGNNIQA